MYIPAHFEEKNLDVLHAQIMQHPFGILFTHGQGLDANHLPFGQCTSKMSIL